MHAKCLGRTPHNTPDVQLCKDADTDLGCRAQPPQPHDGQDGILGHPLPVGVDQDRTNVVRYLRDVLKVDVPDDRHRVLAVAVREGPCSVKAMTALRQEVHDTTL